MQFIDQLAADDRDRCLRVLSAVTDIRTHRGLLGWLQSADMQGLLPHDIVLAVWGDMHSGGVQFDVVSALPGVRSSAVDALSLIPLAQQFFLQWQPQQRPCAVDADLLSGLFAGTALGGHCAWVHGLRDRRTGQDSCYVVVSKDAGHANGASKALAALLPHIDIGFRQVTVQPRTTRPMAAPYHDSAASMHRVPAEQINLPDTSHGFSAAAMSEREQQIMRWVGMGKTNHEIGTILDISAFTVKNHLQRIFKKLDVYSRAQAVSRFKDSMLYG